MITRILLLSAITTLPLSAAVTVDLGAGSEHAGWDQLNSGNPAWATGGYPTLHPNATAAWPAPIAANASGSNASATLDKTSGGGYFAGGSLYNAGTVGSHLVADASPQANLATIVFQADLGSPFAGVPLLSYNGGSQMLAPDFSGTSIGDYLSGFGGALTPTTNYLWQWDLQGLGVTDYSISFSTAPHGTIYELALDTGDTFAQVVPEPSVALLGAASLMLLGRRRRTSSAR